MTAALEGGEWSAARPGRTLPPGKTWYPLYRRLGGPQGRSGRAENLIPTGIWSRTVQPVAQSLYPLSYPAHIINVYIHTYINWCMKFFWYNYRVSLASCTMGTGSFLAVKSGRGVMLTPHTLPVRWSRKSRAIPLLSLCVVYLYRASVPA